MKSPNLEMARHHASTPSRQLSIAMLSVHSCPLGRLGGKDTGGMSVYVRELAVELGKQGHVVDVYTRVHDPSDPQIVELGRNARLIHLRAGHEVTHKLEIYPHLPDFACRVESFRSDAGFHYDLIHSHYWLSGWVGTWVQRWWNVPHVAMFHTMAAAKNALGTSQDEPELRVETEKAVVRACHRVIAATDRERQDLIEYYGAPPNGVSVVPCGVNLDLFRRVERSRARRELGLDDGKVILFVGRIEPLKGIDRLLLALARLRGIQRLRLVAIGGDEDSEPELERLRNLASQLKIQHLITFLGAMKQEDLPRFYSAADVCVVPSCYESFGLVTLESMACGTPVVAANIGGAADVIRQGKTGYVVEDNTPDRLADKIGLILSGGERDIWPAERIRASVAGFGWPNVADRVVKEYGSLVKG